MRRSTSVRGARGAFIIAALALIDMTMAVSLDIRAPVRVYGTTGLKILAVSAAEQGY